MDVLPLDSAPHTFNQTTDGNATARYDDLNPFIPVLMKSQLSFSSDAFIRVSVGSPNDLIFSSIVLSFTLAIRLLANLITLLKFLYQYN